MCVTPERLTACSGDQRRLVVAPLDQPPAMQRHGDDQVGILQQLGTGAAGPGAEGRSRMQPVSMLEAQDQAAATLVIEHGGPRPVVRRPIGIAGGTPAHVLHREIERRAAERRGDESEARLAGSAG